MSRKTSAGAAIQKANALADAASDQARVVRETAEELLRASVSAAIRPSEVIGGLIGGAAAGATAIYFIGVASLTALAIPFIAATGLGVGVLLIRGPGAILDDRARRSKGIAAASDVDQPRLLRQEIEAAKLSGAPDDVIHQLWRRYAEHLGAFPPSTPTSRPVPPLALPPGKPEVPHS